MGTENRNRQSQDNHQRKINKYHIPKTGDGGKERKRQNTKLQTERMKKTGKRETKSV